MAYIDRDIWKKLPDDLPYKASVKRVLMQAEEADVVKVDKVAEILRLMFDDDCACNYNGNDEWLPMVCKYADECPMPKERLGCWKEFVKHSLAKIDGTKERGTNKPKITCLNCKYLEIRLPYGECLRQLKIVHPDDTCEYAEPKERGGEK